MAPERIPVKIAGRLWIAWLDPKTARQVVAEGYGEYLRSSDHLETAAMTPPENAAARTGRARLRQAR